MNHLKSVHGRETAPQSFPSQEARRKGDPCPLRFIKSHRNAVRHQLTDSGGRCPALCLRGGRGLTWVTWRKGEPLVGRVDRHSHDAEWVRGAECGGAEGVGEGLASSPRPTTRQDRIVTEIKIIFMSPHNLHTVLARFKVLFDFH